MNTHPPKRVGDGACIAASNEPDQSHVTAELAKHSSDVAALSSGLDDHGLAALDFAGVKSLDAKDAVDAEIGTDDEEHSPDFTSS